MSSNVANAITDSAATITVAPMYGMNSRTNVKSPQRRGLGMPSHQMTSPTTTA